ncbi:2-amino-4-oxopentanoate thiolase subunit OrtB [Aminivibrio sp.]|jgi:cysteine synthase|uniref:2-amino-4-oxopentanoate thiolase subunit OrtB n=1 Tax=Aminivibrio sp. TaxID=1872489 RepID=UPI003D96148D
MNNSYAAVMARKNEIMKKSLLMDFGQFEQGKISFDYEGMMNQYGYTLEAIRKIQRDAHVGDTPLIELHNLTRTARALSPRGKGARIMIKDEAANPSGSFKDRRASVSCHFAQSKGFPGVAAATSGNYGAALASQANIRNLKTIIVQEVFDSLGRGQPEIVEKTRKCEALGAEVIQTSVGPELFYYLLRVLEETGFFNASLYTPLSIAGIETIGYEIAEQCRKLHGGLPAAVVITHAGGGNVTGTARGLRKAGAEDVKVIGASVNLEGLHMASDRDFNLKSFTTGHTGFGVPFATWPDRSDVPRNAARPLRYLERYVTVNQGEVFYITEALAVLEGLERGPAGNTALTAAFALAKEFDEDQYIVVQETEYTGAGKHHYAQLAFAKENGILVETGDPETEVPGRSIVFPSHPDMIRAREVDLDLLRASLIRNALKNNGVRPSDLSKADLEFLAREVSRDAAFVTDALNSL